MPHVFQVANVNEAVKLARQFKAQGRYKYFRGHADAQWKMQSTLCRKVLSKEQRSDYEHSLERFFDFCKTHDSLKYLLLKEYADHSFAILQHYGVPTHYIDFTRDPSIAAFFATDGENIRQGQSACITCLSKQNIDRVNSLFEHARTPGRDLPADFLVEIDVSNLWRLQAQEGVFLFVPDPEIEKYVTFDKIVFPYTGPVPNLPREKIYPARKSALELLLDSYFDNEQKIVSGRYIKEMFEKMSAANPNVSYNEADDPLDTMHQNLKPGAKPHPSWNAAEKSKWQSRKIELWHEVQSAYTFQINAALFNDDPLVACTRLCVQLEAEMEKGKLSRSQLVDFSVKGELDFEQEVKLFFLRCMKVCWDGMRMLPYTNEEIATSLSNLALIFINAYQSGSKGWLYNAGSKKELYAHLLMGDQILIEMAGLGRGDSSRALVSQHYLSEAFRGDLTDVIAPEHRKMAQFRYDNARLILQVILDPEWLFDFNKLKELFVKEIIPTQVYLRANNDKNPIFFTPVQLKALGLP